MEALNTVLLFFWLRKRFLDPKIIPNVLTLYDLFFLERPIFVFSLDWIGEWSTTTDQSQCQSMFLMSITGAIIQLPLCGKWLRGYVEKCLC